MNNYLKKVNDQILFTGTYLEAYIPDKMFKRGINEYLGNKVKLFGLFNFKVGDAKGEITQSTKLETFNFPSMLISSPGSIETKEMQLGPNKPTEKYHILKFFKDQAIVESTKIISDVSNEELFLNLLIEGGLPSSIPYDKILSVMLKNLEINGMMRVPAAQISCVIGNLYRDEKDLSIPFRKMIGKNPNIVRTAYKPVSARTVCANDSTFGALTFEDTDTMIVSSVNRKRYKKKENTSPLEVLVKI